MAPYPRPACSAREKAPAILDEAEALLDPVSDIGRFMRDEPGLVLDRQEANLALARHNLRRIEAGLSV